LCPHSEQAVLGIHGHNVQEFLFAELAIPILCAAYTQDDYIRDMEVLGVYNPQK
jgi:hypothetical protein